jgi:hypothetical protein
MCRVTRIAAAPLCAARGKLRAMRGRASVIRMPHFRFNRALCDASSRNCRAVAAIGRARVADLRTSTGKDRDVKHHILRVAAVAALFALPAAARAQGVPDGVAHGAFVGENAAGPIGAIVGGAVGGVVGGVEGFLGIGPYYGPYAGPPPRFHHRRHWAHSTRRRPKPANG